jgi:hypothetical protein
MWNDEALWRRNTQERKVIPAFLIIIVDEAESFKTNALQRDNSETLLIGPHHMNDRRPARNCSQRVPPSSIRRHGLDKRSPNSDDIPQQQQREQCEQNPKTRRISPYKKQDLPRSHVSLEGSGAWANRVGKYSNVVRERERLLQENSVGRSKTSSLSEPTSIHLDHLTDKRRSFRLVAIH